jgi:hypothetical protein
MRRQQQEDDSRWVVKAISLVSAGGAALIGGLILSIFQHAPNWVPLTGAILLVCCYAAAAFLAFRHA